MIKELTIKNFRSIREATLELGRFTVLNGANNSGKSSVLYALQVLKNVVTNPNRSVDELLNLGFLNLGGLEETLFLKKKDYSLTLFAKSEKEDWSVGFGIEIKNYGNRIGIVGYSPYVFKGNINVSFPYPLNKTDIFKVKNAKEEKNLEGGEVTWNGISAVTTKYEDFIGELTLPEIVNLPASNIAQLDVIPAKRGFSEPTFNLMPLQKHIFTEDEVATLLAVDKNLQTKVAHYFEKITGKRFSVSMGPGGGFFYLQVREPDIPFTTELVNQGMGVNQILFLLAKILYDKNRLICIDEPEIHLHPTLIEQFVKVLVEIAEKEDKQFVFSTHSEHWMMSLLAEVYEQNLAADDLKVYYLQKEGQETKIEQQEVHPNGQIEGGLKNFMEAQLRLANRFFPAETTV